MHKPTIYSIVFENKISDYGGNYKIFLNLSIAGSVFLMLSFMGLTALNFYKHIYIIYFLAAFMPFAVFLLLIGMGMASTTEYVININNIRIK